MVVPDQVRADYWYLRSVGALHEGVLQREGRSSPLAPIGKPLCAECDLIPFNCLKSLLLRALFQIKVDLALHAHAPIQGLGLQGLRVLKVGP